MENRSLKIHWKKSPQSTVLEVEVEVAVAHQNLSQNLSRKSAGEVVEVANQNSNRLSRNSNQNLSPSNQDPTEEAESQETNPEAKVIPQHLVVPVD